MKIHFAHSRLAAPVFLSSSGICANTTLSLSWLLGRYQIREILPWETDRSFKARAQRLTFMLSASVAFLSVSQIWSLRPRIFPRYRLYCETSSLPIRTSLYTQTHIHAYDKLTCLLLPITGDEQRIREFSSLSREIEVQKSCLDVCTHNYSSWWDKSIGIYLDEVRFD